MKQRTELNRIPLRINVCSVEFRSKAVAIAVAPVSPTLFPKNKQINRKENNSFHQTCTSQIQIPQWQVSRQGCRKSGCASRLNVVFWWKLQCHKSNDQSKLHTSEIQSLECRVLFQGCRESRCSSIFYKIIWKYINNNINQTIKQTHIPLRIKVCKVEFFFNAVAKAIAPASSMRLSENKTWGCQTKKKSSTVEIQSLQCRVLLQACRKSSRSSRLNDIP